MNIDLKEIPAKFAPLLQKMRQYSTFIIVLVVLGMFGFIVLRIRTYATVEPTQAAIDEKLQALQRTQVDQEAIDRIKKLESSNIDVKALFDKARDNPFQE